ncbi:YfiR family protein [Novosphingobium umbonatum]|uniref:YfiR family protein n=1 Tax=Novosphingobium umbonatum TaxID=1908524 RepID=A0A3S2VAL6_9SPHN|nr:YfiR family protein [Novosphingobium umbonatum]RVU07880.1 YfiR family protein [Novosphingobium umbonatum]
MIARRAWRVLLAALLTVIWASPADAADGQAARVDRIYNLLRFVSWPHVKPVRRVCLYRNDPMAGSMVVLAGQNLGDDVLEVVLMGQAATARSDCDIVYVGGAHSGGANGALVAGAGQVLVGEGVGFAESGGTVGLFADNGKIRFAINAKAARQSGIRFSSQVLKLAARVVN